MNASETVRPKPRGKLLVFGAPTVLSLWFLNTFAFRYLSTDVNTFGIYKSRHDWLYVHILCGSVALLLGPVQLWFGFSRSQPFVHRILGIGYVTAVTVSAVAGFYLAVHSDFGWVFATGFAAMAVAWIVSTALATIAVCRRMMEQHGEWMVRSYVLTFAFVTFRTLLQVFTVARLGTTTEQMTAASWLCWSIPLLIAEFVLQGRKILAPKTRDNRETSPDANLVPSHRSR